MVIQVKKNSKIWYIQSKPVRKQPSITPFKSKAWKFTDLGTCQNIRDDVLEYFNKVTICS